MSLRPYQNYKDSGIQWLGKIPSHWEMAPYKRLVDIQNGRDHKHVEQDDGYPVIGSGGPFTFASEYLYDGESVLLGRKGTIDKPLYISGRFWTVDTMYWTKIRPGICGRFAYYAATTIPFAYYSTNTALPSMTKSVLGANPVALPPLSEQQAIAAFLDRETTRIDKLIARKERQAAVLAEREEATFLGVVTGQSRVGPRKSSGVEWIGSIPAHWSAPKFTHVARQETGHTPSRKEESYWVPEECIIPWFSLADVWQIRDGGQIYVHETAEKISELGMENSAARLLPANTVILSRTASVGFPAILFVPMATTQDFAGWVCGPRVLPKFLYYVLRSMKPVFRRLMMGSTHQTIYMPDIRAFRLPLPPLDEQDTIVQQLDQITGSFRGAARKITESVERLQEYRAALITAAVTGQIDIRKNLPTAISTSDRDRFRLVVGAEIIHRLPDNPKRARVKVHKITYLAETHLGIDALEGNYLREAAGPLDRALREETERSLEAAAYYLANQTDGTGTAVTYTPLSKAGQHKAELATLLGSKAETLRSLIAMLADLDRRATEAVATLYAVWNDALIDGETPDDAAIINGVLHEWHTEKGEKFTAADLNIWLAWMRRHNLIPRGQGPRTTTGRLFV